MKRKTFKEMRLSFVPLGFLLTVLAYPGCDLDGVDAGTTSAARVVPKLEAIVPSPLGPSFAIAIGTINGTRYGFLGSVAGIVVFDMSNPARPKEVSTFVTRGAPQGLFLVGTHVFAAGGPGAMIIDVSDPHHPVEAHFLPTPDEARDAEFDGMRELALVVDFLGLRLIDVSTIDRPEQVGAMDISGAPFHASLDTARKLLLIAGYASTEGGGSLRLIDVSRPASPMEIANVEMPGPAFDVAIDVPRQLALVVGSGSGQTRAGYLQLVDLREPKKPVLLGAIDTPGGGFGIALDAGRQWAVVVGDGGNRGTGSLRVIDISDPGRPVDLGGLDLPSRALGILLDADNRLSLVSGGHGLIIARY